MIGGVYIAYPIDQRGPASLSYLFEQIEQFKRDVVGHVKWIFDPGDAFNVNVKAQPDDSLPLINRCALMEADLVVAFLPSGVPTVGVPIEIDRAISAGKHVILFTDNQKSWMLNWPKTRMPHRFYGWEDDNIEAAVSLVSTMEPPPEMLLHTWMPVKVDVEGCLPTRHYEDDAGLDLIVSKTTVLRPGEFTDVPCGVSVELPPWSWGLVTGRSSALRKRGLLVHSGVIDAGYRGPLFAGAWNMNTTPVTVVEGERIAQLIILTNSTRRVTPFPVDSLNPSERGSNGFGSTGA